MPPISPQGSRTGLVTALVVFVILFVTTTILWIYEGAERRNRDERIAQYESKLHDIADDNTIGGPDVAALLQARTEQPQYSGMTALGVALAQRGELAKAVASGAATPKQAQDVVKQTMARFKQPDVAATGVQIPPTASLTDAVNRLADRLVQLNQEKTQLAQALETANKEKQDSIAGRDALLKQKDDQIAVVTKQVQDQMAQLSGFQQKTEGTVEQIQQSSNTTLSQAQKQNEQLTAQINQANAALKAKDQQIEQLTIRLKGVRVNPNEASIQKADGKIVRLPGNNLAVIDLGLGDQMVQGMTFEVYDKYTGIPSLGGDGTREGDMPKGKASIEVVKIQPGYSECRILRKEVGHPIVEGDLIVNLVYDKNQKYNFVVYGDFDLDRDGRASAGDAEVIKRLITQWGGNVTNDVNVNTDFVVMGVEPKVDAGPAKDSTDAVQQAAHQRALAELEKYLDVKKQAMGLNIPILNQNRFLNFVGYTTQAGR